MVACANLSTRLKRHLDRFRRFVGLTIVADRPIDHATPSVTISCVYVILICGLIITILTWQLFGASSDIRSALLLQVASSNNVSIIRTIGLLLRASSCDISIVIVVISNLVLHQNVTKIMTSISIITSAFWTQKVPVYPCPIVAVRRRALMTCHSSLPARNVTKSTQQYY